MNLLIKQEQIHRHRRQTCGHRRESGEGGMNQGFAIKVAQW